MGEYRASDGAGHGSGATLVPYHRYQPLPSIRIVGSGEPLNEGNLVQFHLLYSGPLHVNGSIAEKLAIRRVFHRQLARLWRTNPNLRRLAERWGCLACAEDEGARRESGITVEQLKELMQYSDEDYLCRGLTAMGRNWSRHEWHYVPLVTEDYCLRCRLDVLFLRVDEKRNYVIQGGDIDGRLKTLFDGMRMARNGNELPHGAVQGQDEDPLFVLLQDDDLVSEVNISTDRLLLLPESQQLEPDPRDVYLQITVQLNPVQQTAYSWAF